MKLWKVKVINLSTSVEWWQYGFNRYMIKTLHYLLNEHQPNSNEMQYEILHISSLRLTFSTFKKCLLRKVELIKK